MGKIRTRFIGDENVEDEQKKEQKERAKRKKMEKILTENPALEDEASAESSTMSDAKATTEGMAIDTVEKAIKKSVKKMPRKRGKNYLAAKKKLDLDKEYTVEEAIDAIKKAAFAKFPESVEVHLNVLKDGLKGEIELPYSTGKTVRVAIVDDKLIEQLEQGVIEFDILITHPSFMPKIAKFARTLGPKGLMPNPKAGTVSANPEEVAKKFEKGTLRWKAESKAPLIHQMVAKLTSDTKEIAANINTFVDAVGKKNIKAAYVKSSMSPALKIVVEASE